MQQDARDFIRRRIALDNARDAREILEQARGHGRPADEVERLERDLDRARDYCAALGQPVDRGPTAA